MDRVIERPLGDQGSGNAEDRKALRVAQAARESLSPVEQLEIKLHPWGAFVIVPLFAFANAGVPISFACLGDSITLAAFIGFTTGKPTGVFSFSWLAVRTRIATRPPDLPWTEFAVGGVLAHIGFTMALYIDNLAFSSTELDAAKIGILSVSIFFGGGWSLAVMALGCCCPASRCR